MSEEILETPETVETVETVETPTVETPATPPSTETPAIPANVHTALLSVVRDANERAAAAERRLQELEQQRNAPPPKTQEELDAEYYQSPARFIKSQLAQEIERSIAPLNQFRQQLTRKEVYSSLKTQVAPHLEHFAGVEQYVDQIINNAPPELEITPQVIQQAYVNALGYAIANRLYVPGAQQTVTETVPTPTPQPTVTTPPHRAPSPPPAPRPNNTQQRRALTENERRLMRESGMTEQQWWEFMDMDATKVAAK